MASKALLSQLQGYISALADRTDLSVPSLFYAVASIAAVTIAIIVRTSDRSNVAYLNPKKALDFGNRDLKKEFTINAVSMIAKWFTDNPETPVAVNSDMGVMTVLPSTMANEIATDNRLAVNGLSEKVRGSSPKVTRRWLFIVSFCSVSKILVNSSSMPVFRVLKHSAMMVIPLLCEELSQRTSLRSKVSNPWLNLT